MPTYEIGPFPSASYSDPSFTEAYNITQAGSYTYEVHYDSNSRLYQFMGLDIPGDAGSLHDVKIEASFQADWTGSGSYANGTIFQIMAWSLEKDTGLRYFDDGFNRYYDHSGQYVSHVEWDLTLKAGHYVLELDPSLSGAEIDFDTAKIKWNLSVSFGEKFFTEEADTRNINILTGDQQDKIESQDIDVFSALGGDDAVMLPDAESWIVKTRHYSYTDRAFDAGNGNDTINGGDLDDRVSGGLGNDTLDGGFGYDFLRGGGGDDTLRGGAVSKQSGVRSGNELYGEDGSDTLIGDDQGDFIAGNFVGAPSNWQAAWPTDVGAFESGEGDDTSTNQLRGMGGNDVLVGAAGFDIAYGGSGNDRIFGGAGSDTLFGEKDKDTLYGGFGADVLRGGSENDTLYAAFFDPTKADNAADQLYGEAGNDDLYAWSVNVGPLIKDVPGDKLYGGDGTDRYFVKNGDWIEELQSGETISFMAQRSLKQAIVFASEAGTKFNFFDTTGAGQKVEQFQLGNRIDVGALKSSSATGTNFTYASFQYGDATPSNGAPTYAELAKTIGKIIAAKTLDAVAGKVLGKVLSDSVAHVKKLMPKASDEALVVTEKALGSLMSLITGKAAEAYVENKPLEAVTAWDSTQEGLKLFVESAPGAKLTLFLGEVIIKSWFAYLEHRLAEADWQTLNKAPDTRTLPLGGLEVKGVGAFAGVGSGADLAAAKGTDATSDTIVAKVNVGLLPTGFENLIVADAAGTAAASAAPSSPLSPLLSFAVQRVGNGNAAGNTIVGSDLNDALDGREGDDVLSAGNGRDRVAGGRGNDVLQGEGGDDVLEGGTGENRLDGGSGSDTASYAGAAAKVSVSLNLSARPQATGMALDTLLSVENLLGSRFADDLTGSAGANRIDGGGGADRLAALGGNDTYIVDNARDVIRENAGQGYDRVVASVSYTLAANIEMLTLSGTKAINATGNALANRLVGNGAANLLDGKVGADVMEGGAGNDIYLVDHASDRVVEAIGEGRDTVDSTVSYKLAAGQQIEILQTADVNGKAALKLTGNEFGNKLVGNAGNNVLEGGGGIDEMRGGAGHDTYAVDNARDLVVEAVGGGTDMVMSTVSYTLKAGQEIESLRLLGSTGSASLNLTGNAFGQSLTGNAGANVLDGGLGADVLTGGRGADTFVFASTLGAGNVDHLTDFTGADTIRLSKSLFSALAPGDLRADAFKDLAKAKVDAGDHILYDSRTGDLFYDADGSGRGAAVKFATIDTKVAVTHADFFVV